MAQWCGNVCKYFLSNHWSLNSYFWDWIYGQDTFSFCTSGRAGFRPLRSCNWLGQQFNDLDTPSKQHDMTQTNDDTLTKLQSAAEKQNLHLQMSSRTFK